MGKSLLHPFALIFRFHSKIKGPLLGLRQFLMIESLSKLMKNAFYFMLKLFSLLRYLHLCPDFLVMQKNGLIRKPWLVSKFMTSHTGQKIITIHILPNNISKSKDNEAVKIGHLIENSVSRIYLENSCSKRARETTSRFLCFMCFLFLIKCLNEDIALKYVLSLFKIFVNICYVILQSVYKNAPYIYRTIYKIIQYKKMLSKRF